MLHFYWHKFIIPYCSLVLTALLCFVIASAAGLSAPVIIKVFIDEALTHSDLLFLNMITAAIVVIYFLRGIFFYLYSYVIAKAGNRMIYKLRNDMFRSLQAKEYAFFLDAPSGEIISLFTNDLWLIQEAVSLGLPDLIVESLNLVAIMCIMFYLNWELAAVTFATLPFIILAINHFNEKIAEFGKEAQNMLGRVTSLLHQSLTNIIIVQSYRREEYEYDKFSRDVRLSADEFIKSQRVNALLISLVEFLAAIGLTVIVWYGGREVIQGKLTVGGMVAFLVYIINVPVPVRKVSEAFARMKLGLVAWQRIRDIDQNGGQLVDGQVDLQQATGYIVFKNVSFGYGRRSILKNIDITAEPGDIVALVGPSGAGKSSFANLLLRFYDPASGIITVDGVDIRTATICSLRHNIGFIQQDPILFNISIRDNILYGSPHSTFEEVVGAAKLANAHEFIMGLPGGYDTLAGQSGCCLSGGQRQRIAIARAIIARPSILLLDEPTAALDTEAEKHVMDAVRQVSVGRTTFIITHNLSLLRPDDYVIYLENGQIMEQGRNSELLCMEGYYARAVAQGRLSADNWCRRTV